MKPPTLSPTFSHANPLTRRAINIAARSWIALLVFFSLQPLRVRSIAFGRPLHPLLHASMFGMAAALALMQCPGRARKLIRALGILLLAAGLETGQSLLYGHRTEWKDFASDTVGVLTAVVFLQIRVWAARRDPARRTF